jgi:hypothetical protein
MTKKQTKIVKRLRMFRICGMGRLENFSKYRYHGMISTTIKEHGRVSWIRPKRYLVESSFLAS